MNNILLSIIISICLNDYSNSERSSNLSYNKIQNGSITSKEFNKIHSKDFCQIYTKTDSVEITYNYEAFIVIDSNKIKNLSKIKVLLYDKIPLERKKNKFKLTYKPIKEGINTYDITIINNFSKKTELIKATISFYVFRSSRTSNIDYISLADKMPKFNSNIYTNFNDYLLKSFQKENIKIKGKIIIDYTVLKDGTTRFEQIKQNSLDSYDDEEKIKKIVSEYKDWIPGEDRGKKVNVYISDIFTF